MSPVLTSLRNEWNVWGLADNCNKETFWLVRLGAEGLKAGEGVSDLE